jgi:hypothetical protein
MTARSEAAILRANWKRLWQQVKGGAEMENVGLVGAVAIGTIVSLSAPVLVWALVVAGLHRVAKENSPAERQSRVRSNKAGA